MNREKFLAAIEIISKFHTTEMRINKPKSNFVGDLGTSKFTIHITKNCVGCTTALQEAGYKLSMDEWGMEVDHY